MFSKERDVKDSQMLISIFQLIYPTGNIIAAEGFFQWSCMDVRVGL